MAYVTDPIERNDAIQTDEKWHSASRGNLMSCSEIMGPEDIIDDAMIDDNIDIDDVESLENQTMTHDGMYSWTSNHHLDDIYDYIHDVDENQPNESSLDMEAQNSPKEIRSNRSTESPQKQVPLKNKSLDLKSRERTRTLSFTENPKFRKVNSVNAMNPKHNAVKTLVSPSKPSPTPLRVKGPDTQRHISFSPSITPRPRSMVEPQLHQGNSQLLGSGNSPSIQRSTNLGQHDFDLSPSQIMFRPEESVI